MNDSGFAGGFVENERAVTPVLGFVLLFGILIMLLTMYQVQVVPHQNSQVEFQHFQDVQNDLVDLRNTISTAGQADRPEFTSVTLGAAYRTRVATINPIPPAGTLRASDPYNITVGNGTVSMNISTRFIEYEPRYNEISVGSIWYENSVLYLDERDRGRLRIIEDQNLVTNRSGKLRLTAVQNEFEETGTQRTIVEIYPTEQITRSDLPDGVLTVTIPTRLNKSEYWGDQLATDVDVREDYHATGVHRLNLTNLSISSNNFEFNTVGIREKPIADQSKQNVGPTSRPSTGSDEIGGDTGDDTVTETELPDDVVAYFDQDENTDYDEGGDTSYTVADLQDVSVDGTVRVAKEVVMNDGSLAGISIDADRIVVENDVEMRTTGGSQSIELTSNGEIRLTDAAIRVEGGGADITVQAGTELNADGSSFDGGGGSSTVELSSDGDMSINSVSIRSAKTTTIDPDGPLSAAGASVEGTGGGSTIELSSDGEMNIDSADIRSAKTTTIDPDGPLSAVGASIEGTGGGSTVELNSDGDLNIDSANIRSAQTITIDSGGQLSAAGASIEGRRGGSTIELSSDDDMNIDSADIRSAQTTTIDAGGELSAVAVSIEGTGGGSTIELSSGGDMNIDSANIRSAQTITVDAGGQLSDTNANY